MAPPLTRRPDWEARLNRFLAKHHDTAVLKYGSMDCAIGLATGAILAMTGKDVGKPYRGKYKTALEGHTMLQRKGIKSLEELADKHLNRKPVAFAQRGDIVMHQGCFGVCIGRQSLFFMEGNEPGLTRVETLNCTLAWAV